MTADHSSTAEFLAKVQSFWQQQNKMKKDTKTHTNKKHKKCVKTCDKKFNQTDQIINLGRKKTLNLDTNFGDPSGKPIKNKKAGMYAFQREKDIWIM